MAATPERPVTCTGSNLLVVVPSPSWPFAFYPHAHTVPSLLRATVWKPPAATAATPERPVTCTGGNRSVVVPSPSWPLPLYPHAHTVPSLLRATVW